ncbi:MAG: replicative DNA helicase [Vulcanimicrobiota bacterium]
MPENERAPKAGDQGGKGDKRRHHHTTPSKDNAQTSPAALTERRAIRCALESENRTAYLLRVAVESDFADLAARRGYRGLRELVKRGHRVHPHLLAEHLDPEALQAVLATDVDSTDSAAFALVDLVVKQAQRREIERAARHLLSELRSPDADATALAIRVADDLVRATGRGLRHEPVHIADAMAELARELQENADTKTGLTTGLPALDENGGLPLGAMTIIAGRPSMGKSALTGALAKHIAGQHGPTLYVSGEMPGAELAGRYVAQLREVVPSAGVALELEERLRDRCPLYILDQLGPAGQELATVLGQIERFVIRHPDAKAVVIDHLGHLGRRDYEQTSEASRVLQALSRRTGLAVIVLCQLSRDVTRRPDKTPQLSDLRESGHLEQDADLVLMLHRPVMFSKNADPEEAWLYVRKRRNGELVNIRLRWVGRLTRFEPALVPRQVCESVPDESWDSLDFGGDLQ